MPKNVFNENVVFDFDGVIHSYHTPWVSDDMIPDEPVPGIKEEIERIRNAGYRVIVVSARNRTKNGLVAVMKWLKKYNIIVDGLSPNKIPAKVYIDDRGMRFDGDPVGLLEKINKFKPWTKQ